MKNDKGRSGKQWHCIAAAAGLLTAGLLVGCPNRRVERSSVPPPTCNNHVALARSAAIVVGCVKGCPGFAVGADSCVQPTGKVSIEFQCEQPVRLSWSDEKGQLFPGYDGSSFTIGGAGRFEQKVGDTPGDYTLSVDGPGCPPTPDTGGGPIHYPKTGTLDVFTSIEMEPLPEKQ
ncbi:Ig-like domain-containing protein [Corallococcus exiguus]